MRKGGGGDTSSLAKGYDPLLSEDGGDRASQIFICNFLSTDCFYTILKLFVREKMLMFYICFSMWNVEREREITTFSIL
jgi:hypothetical protein